MSSYSNATPVGGVKWVAILPVAVIVLIIAARSFLSIDAGHVGVVTQFGRVTGSVLDPGLHWIAPWQDCHRFDCRVQKFDGDTECFSKDLQLVGVRISLLSTLRPDKAMEVFQSIGRNYMAQVVPRVLEILKQHPLVMQAPGADSPVVAAQWIGLSKLGDSGVVVATRSWCKGSDYWTVYFNLNETVYQMLKERGFMFPFNRVDVNILNKD